MTVVLAVAEAEACEVVSMAISSVSTVVGAGASSMSLEPVGVTGEEEDMNTLVLSLPSFPPSHSLPHSLWRQKEAPPPLLVQTEGWADL